MNVRFMRTEELIPYERNQKKHDEKQIRNVANSIKRFGWQQPIVIDAKSVIVIGHCRWEAAKMLGLETVPVVCADNLTEDEIRELRIVDNKTNESPWDMEALSIDVQELDFEGFDFDLPVSFETTMQVKNETPSKNDGAKEYDLEDFADEQFACECPKCGFKFNP